MNVWEEISLLIHSKLGSIKTLASMSKLEAKLAKLSVYPLVINICLILVILMTIWITAMSLLGYTILLAFNHVWVALGAILVFNILLLKLLKWFLSYNLKKMSFEKTRHYFHLMTAERPKDESTQASHDGIAAAGKEITDTRT